MADASSSLGEARKEIAEKLQTLSSLRAAPEKIPAKGAFPAFAVVHMGDGSFEPLVGGQVLHGFHDMEIEMHVQRKDLARNYALIEDLTQQVVDHLQTRLKDQKFKKLITWERIDYSLRPSRYGGVETLAVFFTIRSVKVPTILT